MISTILPVKSYTKQEIISPYLILQQIPHYPGGIRAVIKKIPL